MEELKYIVFFATLAGAVPLAVACRYVRPLLKAVTLSLFLPVLYYQATAINFFSQEEYRGSARGMEISLIYVLGLVVLLATAFRRRFGNPLRDFGFIIYLVYFVWSAVTFRNSDNLMYSWFELWKMIMMMVMYLAAWGWMARSGGKAEWLFAAVGLLVVINFGWVIVQHYQGLGQARGCFMHQNSMAMFLMAPAPVFFAYFLCNAKSRLWTLAAIAFVCAGGGILRTYSRGSMACLPLACAVTATICFVLNFKQRMVARLTPIAVIGFLGLALLLPRIIERFLYAPEASKNTRIELAESARNMMTDCPWMGVGLNNWGLKINPPYDYNAREWVYDEKKNRDFQFHDGVVETIYLLVGAECGWTGLGLLLLWFFYYLVTSLCLCWRLARTSQFYIPAGLTAGFLAVFLQSALEWVLKQHVNFASLMVYFAVIGYLNTHWREIRKAELRK